MTVTNIIRALVLLRIAQLVTMVTANNRGVLPESCAFTRTFARAISACRVVVGVGNIYANEALFRAGIDPATPAGVLSEVDCGNLAEAVRSVLDEAIVLGGTTLEEFLVGEERPGYFRLKLAVYGRAGEPCPRCTSAIFLSRLGGRSTYWCPVCQR